MAAHRLIVDGALSARRDVEAASGAASVKRRRDGFALGIPTPVDALIYFDVETKRSILARVRRHRRPDGYLMLGGAETTLNVDETFERAAFDRAGCYRLNGGSGPMLVRS